MQHIPVVSSNLASVGYDPESQILEIRFRSSGIYIYYDVPLSCYEGLMAAYSKGSYFADYIKDRYSTTKR